MSIYFEATLKCNTDILSMQRTELECLQARGRLL